MSSTLSDSNLEKKFQAATNTQDSIQTLSLWLLHHRAHHQKIVAAWMKVLQKAKISHRLTLFYLANDVVQNSKRKGFQLFVNSFAEVLKEATLLVRDDHIRPNIQRVFGIWEQRNIYSPEFIADLQAILANSKVPATAPSKLLVDFKPDMVIKKIRSTTKLEMEVTSKSSAVMLSKLNATDAEIIQNLKDRVHGQQFKRDFDDGIRALEDVVETMSKEIAERNELILLLEQSEIYYDTQRGEAKVVANAYKNFDGRVKALQKKLSELSASLPSPIPSPSPDAPSPTTSDNELELSLPHENIPEKELESLEDVPSPVGSPEGLNLSPVPKEIENKSQSATAKSVGNPIPTLSSFFSHEESGMTSWLDAFSTKKDSIPALSTKPEPKKNDSNSLDSRLSNLLQNIPNLPSGLQNSLFGTTSSGNNTPQQDAARSPVNTVKKDKLPEPSTSTFTPIKDDYSGQNTPLQDEDTHSSQSFFTKLASSNKSQSPKDILKGLTNFIQSATGDKEDSQRKEKFPTFNNSELYDQPRGMSTFIKSIIPSNTQSSQHTSSPSSYFSSPQSSFTTSIRTIPNAMTTTVNSYQTASFDSIPSYSTISPGDGQQHLSYIPSLVPSTTHDDFPFSTDDHFPSDEYNPEMEIFDTDMDLDNPIEDNDVPSPEMEPLSPPVQAVAVDNEVRRAPIPARRLSTLITVVTEGSPSENLPSDDMYKSDKENVTQELMPPWPTVPTSLADNIDMTAPPNNMKDSPNEEFFIGKTETSIPSYFTAPPPPPVAPSNGQDIKYMDSIPTTNDMPLSRIETVQCQRDDMNGRWFGNNWTEDNRLNTPPNGSPPYRYRGPPDNNYYNNDRNFARPNFQPRPNWTPRHRPDQDFHQKRHQFSQRPYGPPPNRRFPFRGRGWGRPPPQY